MHPRGRQRSGLRVREQKPAKEPSTYQELIKAEKLSPEQWQKLNQMAEQRHPLDAETDPDWPLPDSYYGIEETEKNE
jgi:hypothetical protein